MGNKKSALLFLTLIIIELSRAKIYDRCELAKELRYIYGTPMHELATWVCIVKHESEYQTGKVTGHIFHGKSYGIFQINNRKWCNPPGKGCGINCSRLKNSDISDDFRCARKVYIFTAILKGDGFKAWGSYERHCKGRHAKRFIKDCFEPTDYKNINITGGKNTYQNVM